MRTVVFALLLTVLSLAGFNAGKATSHYFGFDVVETAYAQDAAQPAPAQVEAQAVTVVEQDVKVSAASDLGQGKIEIPAWVGSILIFLESTPVVGPYLIKALAFAGIATALLTLLATLLMGLSGALAVLSKGKASPKWLVAAKKWVDILAQVVKYASNYNVQKPQQK